MCAAISDREQAGRSVCERLQSCGRRALGCSDGAETAQSARLRLSWQFFCAHCLRWSCAPPMQPLVRVQHVGSLLRPQRLLEARAKAVAGEITAAELRRIEDEEIRTVVQRQVEVGLRVVSDGEFRRNDFVGDFFAPFTNVRLIAPPGATISEDAGVGSIRFPYCDGKFAAPASPHPEIAAFEFLRSVTPAGVTPRVSVPTPVYLICFRPDGDTHPAAYASVDEFYGDIVKGFRAVLLELYERGMRVVQIDEPAIFVWSALWGKTAEAKLERFKFLLEASERLIFPAIRGLPADLSVNVHLCKGNGNLYLTPPAGYAETVEYLVRFNPGASLLEYDDERSGGFEPLAKVAERSAQQVLLGVVCTKRGELETAEFLEERVRSAAKYVPLERLGLCPQCGFATVKEGNPITEAEQWAKLRRMVEVARTVWGSA